MTIKKVNFPISLDYLAAGEAAWGPWEIVREFVANALDEDPSPGLRLVGEDLYICNHGGQLKEEHLLMGVSEKAAGARGMFGEGAKIAWLVLTRLGVTAHVRSGRFHAWNKPTKTFGKDTFAIYYETLPVSVEGTEVQILGWRAACEAYGLDTNTLDISYAWRFILPGDPRILHSDPLGRMLLREPEPSLYVKGVYIGPATSYGRSYAFSYSLNDVTMNRDRKTIDVYQAQSEIGTLWSSVEDEKLWTELLQQIQAGTRERDIYYISTRNAEAVRAAWARVFGQSALQTNTAAAREAGYRGANIIDLGNASNWLKSFVRTDASVVEDTQNLGYTLVLEKAMTPRQRKLLRLLRTLAERAAERVMVVNAGWFLNPETAASHNPETKAITISMKDLGNPEEAIHSLIHELAHALYGTDDASATHAEAMGKIAARLLIPLVWRE